MMTVPYVPKLTRIGLGVGVMSIGVMTQQKVNVVKCLSHMAVVDSELGVATRNYLRDLGLVVPNSLILRAKDVSSTSNNVYKALTSDVLKDYYPATSSPSDPAPSLSNSSISLRQEQYASSLLEPRYEADLSRDSESVLLDDEDILRSAEARRQERLLAKRRAQKNNTTNTTGSSWKDGQELQADRDDDGN